MKSFSECKFCGAGLNDKTGYRTPSGKNKDKIYSPCRACKRKQGQERRGITRAAVARAQKEAWADEQALQGLKTCSKCEKIKPISNFRNRKENRVGLRGQCGICDDARKILCKKRHPEKVKASHKKWSLKVYYGLTLEEWTEIHTNQGGACKICKILISGRKICVDHCHKTGKVRGLLCRKCNQALGLLDDSPSRLIAAAAYLEKA